MNFKKCMMRLLPLWIVLGGCAATGESTNLPQADTLHYNLPFTIARVDLDLVLQDCSPITAKPTVTITPVSVPSPHQEHHFVFSGKGLKSFWRNRSVKIDLHPNRAIKTVNAESEDRTGAIIGGVIKLATAQADAPDAVASVTGVPPAPLGRPP